MPASDSRARAGAPSPAQDSPAQAVGHQILIQPLVKGDNIDLGSALPPPSPSLSRARAPGRGRALLLRGVCVRGVGGDFRPFVPGSSRPLGFVGFLCRATREGRAGRDRGRGRRVRHLQGGGEVKDRTGCPPSSSPEPHRRTNSRGSAFRLDPQGEAHRPAWLFLASRFHSAQQGPAWLLFRLVPGSAGVSGSGTASVRARGDLLWQSDPILLAGRGPARSRPTAGNRGQKRRGCRGEGRRLESRSAIPAGRRSTVFPPGPFSLPHSSGAWGRFSRPKPPPQKKKPVRAFFWLFPKIWDHFKNKKQKRTACQGRGAKERMV